MLWKTLGGRCIYRSANGLEIYDNYLYRWLTFGTKAIQTLLHKHNPQIPGLNYIEPLIAMAKQWPGDCCLLGLGGAGAAHALSAQDFQHKITAIECDNEVIKAAQQYFMLNAITNLDIIHADAHHYVSKPGQQFKHLIIDLFSATQFPPSCFNQEFIINGQKLLVENGVCAINIANDFELRPIVNLVKSVYGNNTILLPLKKCPNIILFAFKTTNLMNWLNHLQSAKVLKKLYWHIDWGWTASL